MSRIGRQTPTRTVTLPYSDTRGKQAVDCYNASGQEMLEWQAMQLNNMLAIGADGLYIHMKYGLAVPRRNGKNEVIVARELYGLEIGEVMCHTAHRTTTSSSAFRRLYRLLQKAGYTECSRKKKEMPERSFFASKQYGLERIELTGGGTIDFRTRTNNGGVGEGFDLLVIDEAQEYTKEQESALIYTVSASKNPQTIFTGTPPTATSGGSVFVQMRDDVLEGMGEDSGWAEWSIDEQTEDIRDIDLWYLTNPSLGTILSERKIRSEISGDTLDFNIQRLGLWIRYSQKSVFSAEEWDRLRTDGASLEDKRFFGVKYGKDGTNVSLSVASRTTDGRIFVEVIDCAPVRAGNGWLLEYFHNPHMEKVVIDGANGQQILAEEMKEADFKAPVLPRVAEVIVANAMFEQAVFAGSICHSGQGSLAGLVGNCEHRPIGSGGGFGFSAIDATRDISIMDSMILAYWLCATSKATVKQQVSY